MDVTTSTNPTETPFNLYQMVPSSSHLFHFRCRKWKWKWSPSVVSHSLWAYGLRPTTILHPWDCPGKSIGVSCHFLLQRIFPTQGSNPGLPHCRQTLYRLSHQGLGGSNMHLVCWPCVHLVTAEFLSRRATGIWGRTIFPCASVIQASRSITSPPQFQSWWQPKTHQHLRMPPFENLTSSFFSFCTSPEWKALPSHPTLQFSRDQLF